MSDYEKIFSGDDNRQRDTVGQGDNQAPHVSALGKTWSIEEAAKKIESAEEFIEVLKREKRELEEKATSSVKLEEVMKAMQEKESNGAAPTSHVNPEDLKSQVLEALRAEEQAKIAEANFKKSEEVVKSAYGEEWPSKLEAVAKENGLTPTRMKELMKESPALIQRLIGSKGSVATTPTASSVNSSAVLKNAEATSADSVYSEAKQRWFEKRDQSSFKTMLKHRFNNIQNRS